MFTAVLVVVVMLVCARLELKFFLQRRRFERAQRDLTERLTSIDEALIQILTVLNPAGAVRVVFYTIVDGQKVRIRDMKQMNIGQLIPISVEFFDKNGDPAQAENLKYGVTDESIAQIVDLDGKPHAKALKAGTFKVNLVADGRVGEGEVIISGESEDVVVLPLDAVKVALKLEAPIDAPVVVEEPPVEEPPVEEPAPVEPAPEEPVAAAKKAKKK